jgi:outer membrane protein assembly factor BamD
LQFPDSTLVPQAKQRLLEVQEVLAEREYMIGHFYFLKEVYPAAIARLKSVSDTYPLFSGADEVLFELGTSYEREVDIVRRSKLPEVAKGVLIKQYTEGAAASYDRILTRYPLEERADDARKRLQALKQPVPKATDAAIAEDKAEIASRGATGHFGKLMENFHRGPDVSDATKVGEPTLVDPKQASAPDMVRAATTSIIGSILAGPNTVGASAATGTGAPPAANGAAPRSDAAPAPAGATPAPAPVVTGGAESGPPASDNNAVPEMKNDLQPTATTPPPGATAPAPAATTAPPAPVNDAATSSSSETSAPATPAASASATQAAPPANANQESSSKKKKKKKLWPF